MFSVAMIDFHQLSSLIVNNEIEADSKERKRGETRFWSLFFFLWFNDGLIILPKNNTNIMVSAVPLNIDGCGVTNRLQVISRRLPNFIVGRK